MNNKYEKELISYFKEWLNLENIIFWKENQEYLINNNTNCKNKIPCMDNNYNQAKNKLLKNGELANNGCFLYKKNTSSQKCVSKRSVHSFKKGQFIKVNDKKYKIEMIEVPENVKKEIFFVKFSNKDFLDYKKKLKNPKQKYTINRFMESFEINNNILKNIELNKNKLLDDFDSFFKFYKYYFGQRKDEFNQEYKSFLSNPNNSDINLESNYFRLNIFSLNDTLFILFPSGDIISDLYKSTCYFNPYFNFVIEFILQNQDKKIILGGHSMGCVFAQIIGNEILKRFPQLFKEKIIIVGTAPFKWLLKEDKENYDKYFGKNILIFGLKKNDCIDKFLINGNNNFEQSILLLLNNFNDIKVCNNEEDLKKENERCKMKEVGEIYFNILHRFENYKEHLIKIL